MGKTEVPVFQQSQIRSPKVIYEIRHRLSKDPRLIILCSEAMADGDANLRARQCDDVDLGQPVTLNGILNRESKWDPHHCSKFIAPDSTTFENFAPGHLSDDSTPSISGSFLKTEVNSTMRKPPTARNIETNSQARAMQRIGQKEGPKILACQPTHLAGNV
jgi:hypothetical protein